MIQNAASIAPTPEVLWVADNWLPFSDEPPPSIEWLMELEEQDRRVGELLRAQHYCAMRKPLPPMPEGGLETCWLARARNVPGYRQKIPLLEARLKQMQNDASSTAAPQPVAAAL